MQIVVRRKVNVSLRRFFPIVKSTPIRGELEIEEFSRESLVTTFARRDVDILTVPLILFADGFGLYRTMHKSIMGIYHSIAALKRSDRLRQMNIMPLTLGPHASADRDVWEQVGTKLRELEEGSIVDLHGKSTFISGYTFVLVGDFPQQQENSGFRRPTANQGCRFCDVTLTERGNLDFDLTSGEHQRHHHEIIRQRAFVRRMEASKTAREKAAHQFGLALEDPALMSVLPALDIIKSRPADAAHSEYGGLTKMFHLLFVDQVLTPTGIIEYSKALRRFPIPPSWRVLQSPQHVLQYSLVEHGQWSALAPLIVRTWLKSNLKYIKSTFSRAIMSVFEKDIQEGLFGQAPDTADIMVKILVENVRTNILLTTERMPDRDMARFDAQMKLSRRLFQSFCDATAQSVASRGRRRSSVSAGPSSAMPSTLPTVASGTGDIETGPQAISAAIAIQSTEEIEDPRTAMQSVELTTAKSSKYKLWMSRPNVHIGLHYGDVADEYGLVSVTMVIVFEMKHKYDPEQLSSLSRYPNIDKMNTNYIL